jgi:hypothetical protein
MEDWTADADEPRRFSVDRLEGCDLCVLLVAFRRGFVPPGEPRSITQLEYESAVGQGIDVLPFLLDENAPWPRRFDELDEELKRWRTELSTRHGRGVFGYEPTSVPIAPALTRWVTARQRKAVEVGSDWVQLVSNVLGLSKNEPETWEVAARLLPHALAAVEREYIGPSIEQPLATLPESARPVTPAQPFRTLLADTPAFLHASSTRYERICYVLTPLGQKRTVAGDLVDFDAVYNEILAPAIQAVSLPGGGSLEAVRADVGLLSGSMSEELFGYLEYSRLVLADITTPSADVFYELGRRHRARATGTVIVAQTRAVIPFDLSSTRVIKYDLSYAEASRAVVTKALRSSIATSVAPETNPGQVD